MLSEDVDESGLREPNADTPNPGEFSGALKTLRSLGWKAMTSLMWCLHSMGGVYGKYFGTKFYSSNPKHGAYFFFFLFRQLK